MCRIPIFHFYLTYFYVCIYVCVQVRIHVCSHKGQKTISDIFPQEFTACSFEVGPLSSLKLTSSPSQQKASETCLSSPSQNWDYKCALPHPHFTLNWGIKFRSLCLQGKHFANCANSLAQAFISCITCFILRS